MSRITDVEFTLTPDELKQMLGSVQNSSRVSKYRANRHHPGALRMRFSTLLSPEGRLAMEQALGDTKKLILQKLASQGERIVHQVSYTDEVNLKNFKQESLSDNDKNTSKSQTGLSEIFERLGTPKMTEDITDEDAPPKDQQVRSLDGMKMQNSMEIVEIIDYERKNSNTGPDDAAIEEIAKRNSVEKCKVWIEAHTDRGINNENNNENHDQIGD